MKTYELAIRQKIVDFILAGGLKTQAAVRFGVSRSTVYRCIAANAAGNLAPKPRAGTARKIDPEKLKLELEKNPDATLTDLAAIFNVHFVTVWHCMQKMGVKLKRAHPDRKKDMARRAG